MYYILCALRGINLWYCTYASNNLQHIFCVYCLGKPKNVLLLAEGVGGLGLNGPAIKIKTLFFAASITGRL